MLRTDSLSYQFPSSDTPAIGPLDLAFEPGSLTLVTGATGSGKSTVLRLLSGLLQRHGQGVVMGRVDLDNEDPADLPPRDRVQRVAFVSQDPADQIVSGNIADEVAFAPESAGWPRTAVQEAVVHWLNRVSLEVPLDRNPAHLSGGQQQRLVIASGLSAGANIVLLDEPLSQLDPDGAQQVLALLRGLADDGMTVVMVEHRIEAVWPVTDRIVVLASGRVIHDETPETMQIGALRDLGLSIPGLLDLEDRLDRRGIKLDDAQFEVDQVIPASRRERLVETGHLQWSYDETPVLSIPSFEVHSGERVAILGANGSGKSTLLHALAGFIDAGVVKRSGSALLVPQQADLTLFNPSVHDELAYGAREARLEAGVVEARVNEAVRILALQDLLGRVPQACSKGQRLRVAVGAALTTLPSLLLLDEPTAGLHGRQVEEMMDGLGSALTAGAIVFATHDVAMAARSSTRIVVLDEGRITHDGSPSDVIDSLRDHPAIEIPPLIRWCREKGLPPADASTVEGWAR